MNQPRGYAKTFISLAAQTAIFFFYIGTGKKGLVKSGKDTFVRVWSGKDTFVALPTGYGKSLIYAVLPLVFDSLRGIQLANYSRTKAQGQVLLML